ncbi:MAG: energy transducer TonB [Nitrospirae bacterium]|nr:energy transducer TonB [Nitrospirota bacterium]
MSLKRFFAYSFALHSLIILAIIFYIPTTKTKKLPEEFFTRLVSPDELLTYTPIIPVTPEKKSHRFQQPAPEILKPITKMVGPSETPYSLKKEKPADSLDQSQTVKEHSRPLSKEKLFDKNIIGDIAKRDTKKEEMENTKKTFTFDTKEYKFLLYNKKLKERIESIWVYPPDAAAKGIYGDLLIKFSIKKNGGLESIEIIRTSGHKNLDDAALKALKDGAPYWPLPDDWGIETYTIVGHFIYTIYGYFIR